ncbi:MAG: hypothetical protein ACYCUM_08760 [Solirubrobacteraceae bacterium]
MFAPEARHAQGFVRHLLGRQLLGRRLLGRHLPGRRLPGRQLLGQVKSGGPSAVAPTGDADPHGDVIKDARQRQRRRRRGYVLVVLAALLLAALAVSGGGGGGAAGRARGANGHRFIGAGNGISVRVPRGWHLYRPPITSTTYPHDRLLLTSYPTRTGGQCGPSRAERALPAGGALVYLIEYARAPAGTSFPPQSRGVELPAGGPLDYECSAAPSYIVRFGASGRFLQATVAFGGDATASRRAEAMRVLAELRVRSLAAR